MVIRPSSKIHTGYLLCEMTNLTLYCTLQHQGAFMWSFNVLCKSVCWPVHTGKLGCFPTCTAAAAKSLQSCPSLCDPRDGSPPGSHVRGILQARTLEWVAISFSKAWKWKVKVKSLRRVRLFATPWTAAYQAPPSMGFSRLEYWSRVPLPSPPTCTGTQKSTCWELCFQATMLLLLLCLSKFFLNPSAHHPPPLSTLPWWDEYTALGFPGFLNKNYPTFCV